MKRIIKCLGLLAIITLLLPSCALTTEYIELEYQPMNTATAVVGAEKSKLIVSVKDTRPSNRKVSCKKNGYGMEMAGIFSEQEVAVVLNGAITQELSARGFSTGDNLDPNAFVKVEILKFYNDFKVGFFSSEAESEIILNVSVKDKVQANLYSKTIMTKGKEDTVMIMSGDNARLSLEDALRNSVAKLMQDEDFVQALLKKPEEEPQEEVLS